MRDKEVVVYLLNPTSNHNGRRVEPENFALYIFWILHQTTTIIAPEQTAAELYIFWILHQTTTASHSRPKQDGCISFESYIKPQQ